MDLLGAITQFAILGLFFCASAQNQQGDVLAMQALKKSLTLPSSLDWSDSNPCLWQNVQCDNGRVTRIQIGNKGISGTLPPDIQNLTSLMIFEVMGNRITGAVPSFAGLSQLQEVLLHDNKFSSIPPDFFSGLSSLEVIELSYNPFPAWEIPASLLNCSALKNFSANGANVVGKVPDFFTASNFPVIFGLKLAQNSLEGGLPSSFAGSPLQILWLNNIGGDLNGNIEVLGSMTQLVEVWLHGNQFSGPIPELSNLKNLQWLSLRDNQLTGVVPNSLLNLPSLKCVNISNNLLQGPIPAFSKTVTVDMAYGNRFCLQTPGPCDSRVTTLLSIAQSMGYPVKFAENWLGNNPCDTSDSWWGISCSGENITVINFQAMGLTGSISPKFSMITSLQKLILKNNNLSGTIPSELTALPNLQLLDVSNNRLQGVIPAFSNKVNLITEGNPKIGQNITEPPSASPGPTGQSPPSVVSEKKSSNRLIIYSLVGGVLGVFLLVLVFCSLKRRPKNSSIVESPNSVTVVHPQHSGDQNDVKITVAPSSGNGASSEIHALISGTPGDVYIVEAGNMIISIQVLRDITGNFGEENILGKGGFGTVYKGELYDGTKVAVKRMESSPVLEKGLTEFKAEIAVLTKVRHRHLVSLLGYCLDENEKLLVYEYMPQGTLSRHLFHWKEERLMPLQWTKRVAIALDVARGVEYLHNLAHHTFIHRDLKPSNILLSNDMRAKVADFGLVRLAPEGKGSIATCLAGTFGYLAPEYAVTGRVSTKVDVFSFGVILMEIITGRKALDESLDEDSVHLVTWFRRRLTDKENLEKDIDEAIELNEETLGSIRTVAELAGHCCAREPYQRPEMGYVVNVLSSIVELWIPSEPDTEEYYKSDLDMTLPQALKKWQGYEGMSHWDDSSSSYLPSGEVSHTSIPTHPFGFANSFTSADGR
ncbi:hypothetical protein SAY86_010385 [Trapa natans]|uniref:non-specific serine/threonine protein kinase n=1 Tax=Trapa natans TaxID=22666 RepID=A0AAN7LH14_TRANT|nr:hypothetical protein SAY86_010385 [Trapa natans]